MKPFTKSPHSSIFHLLLFLLLLLPHGHADSDPTTLIYHRCTPAQTGIPISADYQCRGDMSSAACQRCVTQLHSFSNTLCTGSGRAARVQLRGCYARYEADEEEAKNEEPAVLHKRCGELVGGYDSAARDGALWASAEGIVRSLSGYYETGNEGVSAVAQCGGGLFGCDCGECVSRAAEVVREECGGAVSGEVYLEGCYVTYTTTTTTTYAYPSGYKKNGSSGKLVAIVLGGAASLGLVLILLMFFKSCGKKDDD